MTGRAFLVAVLLATAAAPLTAQWPKHPVPGAPRDARGAADMQGPVPRTRGGTPDLSGVWENIGWRELQQVSNDISGTGGSPGTRPLVARAT
ncbi:MAG TPA: hypothetical protein VFO31_16910, partial [Vicinamibacterales bacterium]|nr:hypothetical protein [Vicinamibacterales bacterium]